MVNGGSNQEPKTVNYVQSNNQKQQQQPRKRCDTS